MQQSNENRVRPNLGRVLGRAAAVLLFAAALCQSGLAYSGPHGGGAGFHGGGGFHGGVFHGGVGGFHGGGWHGGFAGLHNGLGYGHGSHWYHGWRGGRYGSWWGDGLGGNYYPDYGYYSSGQPSTSQNILPPPPLSAGDHPACGLALFALHLELSGRRGTPRRAGVRHLLRNRPVLGVEIRTDDRATATPSPSAAEHSLAPRRDGNPDCWRADVPVAGRRPRGRGPRHAGSAPTRQPGGAAADAQAAQETRLRPQIGDHRQAALLRRSVPASATDLPA